jgi:hypothetical protein
VFIFSLRTELGSGLSLLPEAASNVCFGRAEKEQAVHHGKPVTLRSVRWHSRCRRFNRAAIATQEVEVLMYDRKK